MSRIILMTLLVALTGCNEDENKTVEHFTDHPAEREAVLADCEIHDAAEADANCANARTAESLSESNANLDAAQKYFGD